MDTRPRDLAAETRNTLAELRAQLEHFTAQSGAQSRLARETRSKINRITKRATRAQLLELETW